MRYLAILTLMLTVTMGGAFASATVPAKAGQPTPAVGSVGVTGGAVGSGEPQAAPGYLLSLRRGVFESGGSVPLHHHPGALVIYVESGALTYSVFDGEALITRAASDGTPGPADRLGPGAVALLRAGDAVYEEGVVHVTENRGNEPSVIWIAALTKTDEPLTQFHEATPAP